MSSEEAPEVEELPEGREPEDWLPEDWLPEDCEPEDWPPETTSMVKGAEEIDSLLNFAVAPGRVKRPGVFAISIYVYEVVEELVTLPLIMLVDDE